MQLVAIDMTAPLRAALVGRLQEAARHAGLQRMTVVEADPINLDAVAWDKTIGVVIGPGCGSMIRELLSKIEKKAPKISLVLDRETYVSEAVAVYRALGKSVYCETDLSQLATFVLDCENASSGRVGGVRQRRVVGFIQLKGGVGATTLALATAHAFATRRQTVVVVDCDEVTPAITSWANVGAAQRAAVADGLRRGNVTREHVRDMVFGVDGFDGRLSVVGQPPAFYEGFHFKAAILDGAPSPTDFVNNALGLLGAEYDWVVMDLSRSWGVGTFASLPWCDRIVLVVDDDALAVRSTIDSLQRLRDESGDAEEFNFTKWCVACNKYSGKRLSLSAIQAAFDGTEIWPTGAPISTIAYSEKGRQWAVPGKTFLSESTGRARSNLESFAAGLAFEGERPTKIITQSSWWHTLGIGSRQ